MYSRFHQTCMPLFESIGDLITELKRQKIREWKDETFSDLTDPCEKDDVETFLQNLNDRVKILKGKRESVPPKLSELVDKYKTMSQQNKVTGPGGRERGLTPKQTAAPRFHQTCMPLFESIGDLITELKRQKIREWKDETFSDLTDPCEKDDVETFLQNLNDRVKILKGKRESVPPKLSELVDKYKTMSQQNKVTGPGGRERGLTPKQTAAPRAGFAVQGKGATNFGRGQQPSNLQYDDISKAVAGLASAVELRSFDKVDFQCPEAQTDRLKKDFEALEKIRNDLQNKKSICEWLSSGIEDLKSAAKTENYEYDIMKNKPSNVTKAVENLEFIRRKLNGYKETFQKQCDNQKMLENWLDHIHQLLTTTSSEPTKFEFHDSMHGADMMKKITTNLWECILQRRTLEAEQDELKKDLDICCNKLRSATKIRENTEPNVKTNFDLKSTMAMLKKKTAELIDRMKKTENELKAERETKERLTEEKDKLLKSKTTGEESQQKLLALEKQVEEYKNVIDSLNSLYKGDAVGKSTSDTKEKQKTTKDEEGKVDARKTVQMVEREISESAKQIAALQQELKENKEIFNSIYDLLKDKDEDKSKTSKNKSHHPKKDKPETPDAQEKAHILLSKVKKLKDEQEQLSQEVASCYVEIKKIGLTNSENSSQQKLVKGRQNREDDDVSLSAIVEMAKDRVEDMKERLADEVSKCNEQNEDTHDKFKLIKDICTQLLEQEKPKQGNSSTGRDLKNLVEMRQSAVQKVMDLTDKFNKLEKMKNGYEEEISQLRRETREAQENITELRNRLSRYMGADLMVDNPNIADRSDTNRPTKLAESFSELYDNEWTNAFEDLKQKKKREDVDIVKSLLDLLKCAYDYCSDTAETQLRGLIDHVCMPAILQVEKSGKESKPKETDTVSKQALNDLRKKTFAVASANMTKHSMEIMKRKNIWDDAYNSKSCQKYIKSCIDICWLMAIQSPPMYLDFEIDKKSKFDDKKYKAYMKAGKKIDFMVWPPIYLTKGGNLLAKGVVEGK